MCPARSTARETAASFSRDRCVRAPLYNTTTERPRDRGVRASLTMYLATLVCPISTPSLRSSPMDPRRPPQRIGNAHLADQLAYLQRNCWPATPRFRFPSPIQSEASAMPFDYGL